MLTTLKWSLLIILLVYLLVMMVLYIFQRNLLYFPRTAEKYEAEQNFELDRGDVTLKGWVVNPGSESAIIYFGGNAERIDFNLDWMPKLFAEHTLYLVNYRGYGGSEGKPTETHITEDALALYDHIEKSHRHISILGRSLGSGVATHVAARRPLHKLALITPYDSILNIARSRYAIFPVKYILHDRWESWRNAARITSETLIMYGEKDNIVPPSSTRNLIAHFDDSVLSVSRIEQADHDDIIASRSSLAILRTFMNGQPDDQP